MRLALCQTSGPPSASPLPLLLPSPSPPPPLGNYDNDPVVNTIRQLKKEDRRDRDMCCGEGAGDGEALGNAGYLPF